MSKRLSNVGLTMSTVGATLISAEHRSGELLYLSRSAEFSEGSAVRGGIPVIAPGFGTFLGGPKHGWARTTEWDVSKTGHGFRAECSRDGVVLGLDAALTAEGLEMRLTAQSTLDESTQVQLGFHPYFQISDIAEITLTGAGGCPMLDRVDDSSSTAEDTLTVEGEFDRIITGTPAIGIHDAGTGRTITVTGSGHDSVVVWNPGRKKADSLADLPPREWSRFVCVEPLLLGAHQQGTTLSPGEIITVDLNVAVS